MNILAIDQGTSSTKALVVADGGVIRAEVEVSVHPRYLGPGAVEQDPEELWTSVVDAGAIALREAGVPVDAVGLANQGETVLAWDPATGRPLSVAQSWQDRRAIDVCERLEGRAAELEAVTGLPLDPYFAAPKMARIRERITRAGVVTTSDAWLIYRLTGAFVTDAATASRTLLFDLDRGTWSSAAVDAFGLAGEQLPEVVSCAGMVGETGVWGPSIPIAGLAVDQQAALFAQGCHEERQAKCTYGTGAFLLANAGRIRPRTSAGLSTSIAWRLGETSAFCLDGQVYTAGSALTWLQGLGLIESAADLDNVQARDAGGVRFVPALAGLAAPHWKPGARGSFVGLSLATTRDEMIRAVVEGIAGSVALLAQTLGQAFGSELRVLRVDGGLTRSVALMQTQADLLQAPVEVYPSAHATALGVAALARLGLGDTAGAMAIALGWNPAARYEPRMSAADAAERLSGLEAAIQATVNLS